VEDEVEFYGRLRATTAIRRADVCLLLVDAAAGAANQDFRIGHSAWEEGCGLVFVANKWDLIEDRGPKVLASFERQLRERAHYLRWVPIVTASAKSGQRVRKVLEIARGVQESRSLRIPTAEVNRVLERLIARQQPAQGARGDVRLLYGSQVATAPPMFVLWSNRPDEVRENYLRYLTAGFRSAWGFEGSPIRIKLKKRSERR
jgi:GTP-binding protein